MAQAKVVKVGFRGYEVLTMSLTDEVSNAQFQVASPFAEYLTVRNLGSKTASLRINHPNAPAITILPNSIIELPIKGGKFYGICPTAADTTTLEIIGYTE